MVKHVVKGEKWACSTPGAGKSKPVMFITKTRDFKRFCEETKKEKAVNKYQNILARICRIAIPGHRIELGAEQIRGRSFSFYE